MFYIYTLTPIVPTLSSPKLKSNNRCNAVSQLWKWWQHGETIYCKVAKEKLAWCEFRWTWKPLWKVCNLTAKFSLWFCLYFYDYLIIFYLTHSFVKNEKLRKHWQIRRKYFTVTKQTRLCSDSFRLARYFTGQCINIILYILQYNCEIVWKICIFITFRDHWIIYTWDETEKNILKKGLYLSCLFGAKWKLSRISREGKDYKNARRDDS